MTAVGARRAAYFRYGPAAVVPGELSVRPLRRQAALLAKEGMHHCYLRATRCSSCSGCDHRASAGKAQ